MAGELMEWLVAGGVIAIAGFSISTYRYTGKVKDETDVKVARTYERLDEVKENIDMEYARKDMCHVLHKQISEDLSDIKTDLKLLLRKNGIPKDG